MNSLSFDGLTALYDQTRTLDLICFGRAMDWLTDRFPPSQYSSVLEPGIGTGRIALPLAVNGYQVTGLDISGEMLEVCAAQGRTLGMSHALHCLQADATCLPLRAGAFDLCVAVHLFYFISNWQEAVHEILRALKPFGTLVLLHTGFGAEVPALNERYREAANELGYVFPSYGVRSTSEVVNYAVSLGYIAERVDAPEWEWTAKINLREAQEHLRSRAYSFTKDVPEDVHLAVMNRLRRESIGEPVSAETEIPNCISITLLRRTRRRIIAPKLLQS